MREGVGMDIQGSIIGVLATIQSLKRVNTSQKKSQNVLGVKVMISYLRNLIRGYEPLASEKINVNNIVDEHNSFSLGEDSTQLVTHYYIDGRRKERHYCIFEASFPQTDDPQEQIARVDLLQGLINYLNKVELPDSDEFIPLSLDSISSVYQYVFRDTYIRYRFRFNFEFKTLEAV